MIHVDESDPIGELEPSFPYRDVTIKRGVEAKEFYDLESEIGRGKFGTVYRCREKSTGLTLAAKFIPVPQREDRRNVEREVDIMRQLQHPRLIQLYDAFDNGKVMCVVLELIEGGELFERVIDDDFILTEKSCTVFMRQICEGIEFVHKQNILHLDMKPENILCLTKTGNRIKIIDFGLARRYDPNKKLQVLFGTPEFVAPEVVNFDQIGYGTDMWSVGVICYVLLSGLSPFMGETDIETMANVTIAKYDFDDEAFADISEEAKDFIGKLLIKNREDRLTASQCIAHPWFKRKPREKRILNTNVPTITPITPPTPGLDTTKDNLRLFVERWSEHPNSPYIFDTTSQAIHAAGLETCQNSLKGMSPSPCGSIGSTSPDAVIEVQNEQHVGQIERRASDSTTCQGTKIDTCDKINLAEEIKKLSDKLFQLATMPVELRNETAPIPVGTNNGEWSSSASHKRSKFKFSNFSRDVPYASPPGSSTKDLLLKLLDKWDDTNDKTTSSSNGRHKSVSMEWPENDNLGQRTISSLNTFFQSRQTVKKTHSFMSSN